MPQTDPVETATLAGHPAVVVHGDFDMATAPAVDSALAQVETDRPSVIALDLRDLQIIDSSGLRVVVDGMKRARDEDRRLVIVAAADGPVGRLLALTLVGELSEVVEDPADIRPAESPDA